MTARRLPPSSDVPPTPPSIPGDPANVPESSRPSNKRVTSVAGRGGDVLLEPSDVDGLSEQLSSKIDATKVDHPLWMEGPVNFNDFTNPGVYVIGGPFLNGNPTTYNQPGNTGMLRLQVTVVDHLPNQPIPAFGPVLVIQQYVSIDGANKGGQRRRWQGTWSGWMVY